jgi:uncharacterized membrane protein (UPF0127 family)
MALFYFAVPVISNATALFGKVLGVNLTYCLIAVIAACTGGHTQGAPQLNLPRTQITAGMYLINAQVAATPEQRATGLMYRQQMPPGEGMLFAFEQVAQQCFWMKDTPLPLTAAFVADDGTIVNLADMKPLSTESHCSSKPVRYVLEMNQGWFGQKGLKAGSKLSGPPFAGR